MRTICLVALCLLAACDQLESRPDARPAPACYANQSYDGYECNCEYLENGIRVCTICYPCGRCPADQVVGGYCVWSSATAACMSSCPAE